MFPISCLFVPPEMTVLHQSLWYRASYCQCVRYQLEQSHQWKLLLLPRVKILSWQFQINSVFLLKWHFFMPSPMETIHFHLLFFTL